LGHSLVIIITVQTSCIRVHVYVITCNPIVYICHTYTHTHTQIHTHIHTQIHTASHYYYFNGLWSWTIPKRDWDTMQHMSTLVKLVVVTWFPCQVKHLLVIQCN